MGLGKLGTQSMKTIRPKVSVIMPVYNSEKYVAQAIKSILQQTFKILSF
jgi:glycosyltransferase involved in cell wall biosynthesis